MSDPSANPPRTPNSSAGSPAVPNENPAKSITSADLSPNEQSATAPWIEAADDADDVSSTRKPLAPDSLGG